MQEGDPRFRSALTAHPVRDPVHMYQLHKAFARAELERTYQEIQELQVLSGLGVEGVLRGLRDPKEIKLSPRITGQTCFPVPVCFYLSREAPPEPSLL